MQTLSQQHSLATPKSANPRPSVSCTLTPSVLRPASEFSCDVHKAISWFHLVLNYPFAAKEIRSTSKEDVFALATAPLQQQPLSLSQAEVQLQSARIKELTESPRAAYIYTRTRIHIHPNVYTRCEGK